MRRLATLAATAVVACSATLASAAEPTGAAGGASARIERQLAADGGTLTSTYPPPDVTADGWIVYDEVADEPIAGRAATTPRPIASLVKLMTALLVADRVEPDELVEIPAAVNDLGADAARMDARPGERWPARDLLRAMLVHSANDAAIALSLHVTEGDAERFVELMNERAARLGMDDSTFASATGLDTTGRSSTSTPVDLVALTRAALAEPRIADAVAERTLELARPGGGRLDPLPNRNPLLGRYEGVDGGKTGFTDAAGYMLVVHHEDAKSGGRLIVVTFASDDEAARSRDAAALLDWARPLRQQVLSVEGGTPLGSVPVQRSEAHVEVFACDDLYVTARVGQRIEHEVVLPRSVAAPIAEGDELGELRARAGARAPDDAADTVDGDAAGRAGAGASAAGRTESVPICAGSAVRERSRVDRVADYARDWRGAWRNGVDEVEDVWSSLREQVAA